MGIGYNRGHKGERKMIMAENTVVVGVRGHSHIEDSAGRQTLIYRLELGVEYHIIVDRSPDQVQPSRIERLLYADGYLVWSEVTTP